MSTRSTAQIEVETTPDHLDLLSKASPVLALAELIWNAFDADAHEVHVNVTKNALGNVEEIVIKDDGMGLPYDEAETAFGHLGGSWKKSVGRTLQDKRILHGKEGKGRFKAFALGNNVTWKSAYRSNGSLMQYQITGSRANLKRFSILDPEVATARASGMSVTISQTVDSLGVLGDEGNAREHLTEIFALYLHDYPSAHLYFRNEQIVLVQREMETVSRLVVIHSAQYATGFASA